MEPVAVGATGGQPDSLTHEDAVLREKLRHMGKSKLWLKLVTVDLFCLLILFSQYRSRENIFF